MKRNFKIFYRACFLAVAAFAVVFAIDAARLRVEYLSAYGSAPFWLYILPSCAGYGAGAVACGILGIVFWRKAKRKG